MITPMIAPGTPLMRALFDDEVDNGDGEDGVETSNGECVGECVGKNVGYELLSNPVLSIATAKSVHPAECSSQSPFNALSPTTALLSLLSASVIQFASEFPS